MKKMSRWFRPLLLASALIGALAACSAPNTEPTAIPLATARATFAPHASDVSPTEITPTPISPTANPVTPTTEQPTITLQPTDVPRTVAPQLTDVPLTITPQLTDVPPTITPQPTDVPPTVARTSFPPLPPAVGNYFGVNTNGELVSDAQQRTLAQQAGVQMVRTSVNWSGIEANAGEYNWTSSDRTLQALLENNFEPLVILWENPKWAANSRCGPVNDMPAFDRFVRALGARYPRVKYWVMYNEPDNSHFPEQVGGGCFGGQDINNNGKADVQDYAEQLRVAWRALHAVNPNVQLVTGALALDNFDEATAPKGYPGGGKGGVFNAHFLDELLNFIKANPPPNGERYFDVLAFNFYDIYAPYWQRTVGGIGVGAKTKMIRDRLNAAGLNAPLLVGETGVNSYDHGGETQAQLGIKTFVRGLANNLSHVMWWTWQDYPDSSWQPSNTWKYGLIDQAVQPKPMYSAYQYMSKQLTGASFVQPLQLQGGEGYMFDKDGAGIAVVWSSSENPVTVAFSGTNLQVTDIYGAARSVADGSAEDHDSASGRVGIQVDLNPVYVQTAQ